MKKINDYTKYYERYGREPTCGECEDFDKCSKEESLVVEGDDASLCFKIRKL